MAPSPATVATGRAPAGIGESDTENRSIESVQRALSNPLLDIDINGAKGALINISGGFDMTIRECQEIVETVGSKLNPDAKIIWGAQILKELSDTLRTMIIITGASSPQVTPLKDVPKEKSAAERLLGIDVVD